MTKVFYNRYGRKKYVDDVVPIVKKGYFAVLLKDKHLLLTYPPHVEIPELPGGEVNRNENFRDCLFRKLYEETGFDFMLDKGIKRFEQTVNYFDETEKSWDVCFVYNQTFLLYDANNYAFDIHVPKWKTPETGYAEWVNLDDLLSEKTKLNYFHLLALKKLFS